MYELIAGRPHSLKGLSLSGNSTEDWEREEEVDLHTWVFAIFGNNV